MKKAFYKAIHSHSKDLVKYTGCVADQFDAEIIHKLRTTYKKLRALLRWQNVDKKTYTSFKKIYHLAGEIRIIQVAKKMLAKEKGVPRSFTTWLSAALADKKNRWIKLYSAKAVQSFQRRLENVDVSPGLHKKFFLTRIAEINTTANAVTIPDEALHEIRKMIKDIQYVLVFCKARCEDLGLPKHLAIPRLKTIGTQIGSFNDTRMMVDLLAQFVNRKDRGPLSNTAYAFIDNWQTRKEMQKEKLVRMLKKVAWLS